MSETKFNRSNAIPATEFGKLIGCSFQAVKKMFGEKLTEGHSYIEAKQKGKKVYLVDVDRAKIELRLTVKTKSCKNQKLIDFLEFPKNENSGIELGSANRKSIADIAALNLQQVREEMAKSELRISLLNEQVLEGKYVERILVEKNLEAMGMEIRTIFSGLPGRVSSQMRAAKSDREAEIVLHKNIEQALNSMASIIERDINNETKPEEL